MRDPEAVVLPRLVPSGSSRDSGLESDESDPISKKLAEQDRLHKRDKMLVRSVGTRASRTR
jgi:hypothetical protein